MIFEIGFVFFISLEEYEESIRRKDLLLDQLDLIGEIVSYDVCNDGEDWCVECIADVECERKDSDAIDGVLTKLIKNTNEPWDYHYIKGIDNDFYWQP